MRQITKIIVHCTATPEGREVDVDEIRKWHTDPPRNWSDIGYHFHIKLDGELQEGRPIERTGAHCSGQNYCSIGISYAGGMTKDMKEPKTYTHTSTKRGFGRPTTRTKRAIPKSKDIRTQRLLNKGLSKF